MRKKYKVSVDLEYIIGHLRYAHLEGTMHLTDEEYNFLVDHPDSDVSIELLNDVLHLVVDDYGVDTCGPIDPSSLCIEEVD